MARPYRETGEVEPFQDPAHVALADLDSEARLDLPLKVDAAPTHHPVRRRIRAGLHQASQLSHSKTDRNSREATQLHGISDARSDGSMGAK